MTNEIPGLRFIGASENWRLYTLYGNDEVIIPEPLFLFVYINKNTFEVLPATDPCPAADLPKDEVKSFVFFGPLVEGAQIPDIESMKKELLGYAGD